MRPTIGCVLTLATLAGCKDDCPAGELWFEGRCQAICMSDDDCDTGCCSQGVCARDACPPEIQSVDGDGSIDGLPQNAPHRLAQGVVVTGRRLGGVRVSLTSRSSLGSTFASLGVVPGSSSTSLRALLPETIPPGEYLLSVANQAGDDSAPMTVLQGERGAAGVCDATACTSQMLPGVGHAATLRATAVATAGPEARRSVRVNGVELASSTADGIWLTVLDPVTHALRQHSLFNRNYELGAEVTGLVVALREIAGQDIAVLATQGDVTAGFTEVLSTGTSVADELMRLGASERLRALLPGDAFVLVGQPGIGLGNAVMTLSSAGSAAATALLADDGLLGPHTRDDLGTVGIGTIVAHTIHLGGATSLAAMRARGFALCDGTTPAEQGIQGAVITAPTPNLNDGRFLRGGPSSGALQDDALQEHAHVNSFALGTDSPDHTHGYADNSGWSQGNTPCCVDSIGHNESGSRYDGGRTTAGASARHTHELSGAVGAVTGARTNGETRPANMSVLWLMRVK